MSRPRLGFLGVGWIGRSRLEAVVRADAAEIVAFAEPSDAAAEEARGLAPGARRVADLEALLALNLDGLVIATPSALHAEQATLALRRGAAVFCQKPLGRTGAETGAVVEAARAADRLLAVDLSYRFTAAMQAVRRRIAAGDLGRVYAADLLFHNAYGPDKAWFRDRSLSGGGCVVDLGVHLVDLALWALDYPQVRSVSSQLFAQGRLLAPGDEAVEDYALATLVLESGATLRLACSWNLPAGCEAVIAADFWGTQGGGLFRNQGGSFFDFTGELTTGATGRAVIAVPPDAWPGRAAVDWARRLAADPSFDADAEHLTATAAVLDRIYAG